MKEASRLKEFIFPSDRWDWRAKEVFQSCYLEFSEQFILCCCLSDKIGAEDRILNLQRSFQEMLNLIWKESLIMPAEDWVFQYSEHEWAAESAQKDLLSCAKDLQSLVAQSSISERIARDIDDQIVVKIKNPKVTQLVQGWICALTDDAGDDLYKEIVKRNWQSIFDSSDSNPFAKWCFDKFGPVIKSLIDRERPSKLLVSFECGRSLEGEFFEGLLNGKGIERQEDKVVFNGNFDKGVYHGNGTLNDYDKGVRYDGQFKEGLRHGQGKQVWSNGIVYEGSWKDNERHGQGKQVWSDGRVYEGDWKIGKMHGQGRFVWPHGVSYEGGFWGNSKHGHGKFTWKNESSYEGLYRDDERIDGTILHEGRSFSGLIQTNRSGNSAARLTVTTDDGKTVVFEYSDGVLRLIE